ncbi:MAG: nucleotidyltransferase domain-containing protein [Calditrichaeota bacterium]|nr:nucleotidyltransferase domain-containing protein [Calditrichota bacterium]
MISEKQIKVIANRIAKKIKTSRIFVFGSFAYGKPGQDSDLDLCIITNLMNRRKIEIMREIRREISRDYQIPMDILIYDNKEFEERARHQNTLEHKILKQGILVYG